MAKRRFEIRDMDTQQAVEGYGLIVPRRAPHPYGRDGVQVAQIALRDLAINTALTKRALRIALWLLSDLRRPPFLPRSRQEIAKALSMHKSDVTKGLQELFAVGMHADGDGVYYRPILPPAPKPVIGVRPSVAWKGPSGDLVEAIADEKKADERIQAMLAKTMGQPAAENVNERDDMQAAKSPFTLYPPEETLAIARRLAKAGTVITLAAIQDAYPTTRRPSESALRKIINGLIERKELVIAVQGKSRQPSIYASPPPPQDAPSRPTRKKKTAPAES